MQAAALSASSDRAAAWFERALQPGSGLTAGESPGSVRILRASRRRRRGAAEGRGTGQGHRASSPTRRRPPATGGGRRCSRAWLVASAGARRSAAARGEPGHAADARDGRPAATPACGGDPARGRRGRAGRRDDNGACARHADRGRSPQRPPTRASMPSRCCRWRMPPAHQPIFESVIGSTEPDAVQIAGVNALRRVPGAGPPAYLLAKWPTLTPPVRSAAADRHPGPP